ncbi:SwmB domain-containing protein [Verminephrobacter aporrectodeae]|uniref:Uncharacterized protein n=2 Tax=Verminephrobacter TaxID=364316 RepID=A0ABT3KT08_9BURK|nr:SwmB domain-containing protein [Verminephrobacter aporrectodeae]MCW5222437.1 hypothetical protein [Verminephrobacter aporrectodeae subsp. tuberculatae]MCW5257356.1 hypothetical protein [Verminephrobacter aporrectodeae subsp. tuberculatae]MCW5287902.1 hypothetical protein [Verminephrobacter aporrectodeae subsp. tuberculatae]MCW5321459.1 hypothetical protein [Verminephrobacter aporrectodeae subsp. tuberculatae]MCW8165072.1 hypothetical protein [Verminephrobacter aporrectodeae subsp. tubercula
MAAVASVTIWAEPYSCGGDGCLLSADSRTTRVHFDFDQGPWEPRFGLSDCNPVFDSTTVTGDQLVGHYTEANGLDGAALADSAGFTVRSTAGTAIRVNSAVLSAADKTVTLTLGRAVTSNGNGVQDSAQAAAASTRALDVNGYWAKDSTGTWVNLIRAPYGGKMTLEGRRRHHRARRRSADALVPRGAGAGCGGRPLVLT